MTTLHTDHPIDGSEKKPDLLGREQYASVIGKALLLEKDMPGIVASIEGEWGYGKTSFLNLIKKYFESLPGEEHPIIVDFNPWMVSGAENLVQEFLVQLASKIDASDSDDAEKVQSAAKQVLSYSKIFTAFKFIPGVEPWASIAQGVMESVGDAAESIGKLKELSIEDKRDKTVKAIGSLDKPIVVFIDDIDRLPPNEVFDTVRLVKAVADFPRVSFILAYEPIYVSGALKKFGIKDGLAYMEKIVQTRIYLPLVNSEDIQILLDAELKNLHEDAIRDYFPNNQGRLGHFFQSSIKYLLRTPRDVKRLFNRLYVSEINCRGEVEFSDLFALEVIALKAPILYDNIRKNMGIYAVALNSIDVLMGSRKKLVEEMREGRDLVMKNLKQEDQKAWRKLLDTLFPLPDADRIHAEKDFNSANGRIVAEDRLKIALGYGVPKNEVSMIDAKAFLENSVDREKIIDAIMTSEKIERFIEVLQLLTDDVEINDQEGFFEILSELAESDQTASIDEKAKDIFSVSFTRKLWWLSNARLDRLDKKERLNIIIKLISNPNQLSLGTEVFHFLLRQHGFYDDGQESSTALQWCTDEELEAVKGIWKESVRKSIETESIWNMNNRSQIIFMLSQLDSDMAKNLIGPMILDDEKIDKIVMVFGKNGSDSRNGDYSHVKNEFLELIGNPDEIRARARARLDSDDPPQLPLWAIYKSIDTGKKFYLADGSEGEPNWS